jgi:hypothetical protein
MLGGSRLGRTVGGWWEALFAAGAPMQHVLHSYRRGTERASDTVGAY